MLPLSVTPTEGSSVGHACADSSEVTTFWFPERYFVKVGMKSKFTILIFICNIVVFIINGLSVHFIIFLKFMCPHNL